MTQRVEQLELVGRGAMAEVYRGHLKGERGTNRPVAIKRLRAELREDAAAVDLFVNEARIAVSLNHTNVVHALELGRDDAGYFLMCEWLDCSTLADLYDHHQALPWPAVVQVGLGVCNALAYLHGLTGDDGESQNLVHRDITPSNVFITRTGNVKLGDFGVATRAVDPQALELRAVGTPGFAAPEQSTNGTVDCRADIFGLGASLRSVAEPGDAELVAILERATAERPGDRFGYADEMARALSELAQERSVALGPFVLAELVDDAPTPAPEASSPALDGALHSILGPALGERRGTDEPASKILPGRGPQLRWLILGLLAVGIVAPIGFWSIAGEPALNPPPEVHVPPEPSTRPTEPPAIPAPALAPTAAPGATAAPAKARPKVAPGTVSLNTVPWAEVTLGGQKIGNTPLKKVKLPAGRQTLRLEHPPTGLSTTVVVEITSDREQTFVINLRSGAVEKRSARP